MSLPWNEVRNKIRAIQMKQEQDTLENMCAMVVNHFCNNMAMVDDEELALARTVDWLRDNELIRIKVK